jgi:hypothetical protein
MLLPTLISAIFYEVAAITFLQFDVIHFCGAAVCTTYDVCLYLRCAAQFFTDHKCYRRDDDKTKKDG